MIVKKLKFLLKPPIPSLLLSSVALSVCALFSRVSVWGTFLWVGLLLYIYFSYVSGRGAMGWSFLFHVVTGFLAIRGVFDTGSAIALVGVQSVLVTLFLLAIQYYFLRSDRILRGCRYVSVGLFVLWWSLYAATSMWIFLPLMGALGFYVYVRDEIRFRTHIWEMTDRIWYGMFSYLGAFYIWAVSLLAIAPWYSAALFLVWYVLIDDVISVLRTKTASRSYYIEIILLYCISTSIIISLAVFLY